MYSKTETSNLKKEFWTVFGRYMKPVKNFEGEYINWVNYKTGVRHIYFRMDVEKNVAVIAIEIRYPDKEERLAVFEKFESLKKYFSTAMPEVWAWQKVFYDDDGRTASRIFAQLKDVSIFNKADWSNIITFLKERIIKLDAFWSEVKVNFEQEG